MIRVPIEGRPGEYKLLSNGGKSLGTGIVRDGTLVIISKSPAFKKHLRIRASKRKSGRDPSNVIGKHKRKTLGPQESASGTINEGKLWPCLVLVVRTEHYSQRKDFFAYCKKNKISYLFVEGEEPLPGEMWLATSAYEISSSNGSALEKLCGNVPPYFVVDWYYVLNTVPPRLGMGSSSPHGRPHVKKGVFKWHEAGNDWVKMKVGDLTAEQVAGLGKDPKITGIMGLVGTSHTTPYVWLLGCTWPLKWNWKLSEWMGATAVADLGKVPKPMLCKVWLGCEYKYFWVRSDGVGGQERSIYLPTAADARIWLSTNKGQRGIEWYGEGEVERDIADGIRAGAPAESKAEFTNDSGWIGR